MMKYTSQFRILLLAAGLFLPVPLQAEPEPQPQQKGPAYAVAVEAPQNRISEEKSGTFVVREGQRLRVNTDVGTIHVRTSQEPRVSYTVRVETLNRGADAQKLLKQFVLVARPVPDGVQMNGTVPWGEFRGRLWVSFDIVVPRVFQLDLATEGGDIETDAIDGRISLVTGGGNLAAGAVRGPARLETKGGHVTVQDVDGELIAVSAGGHINVGNVQGNATVRTGGGHVRVGHVRGIANLETGGGNIFLQKPGAYVTANAAGGRIDFGEAAGGIRARTAGGNIGILKVSGPTELESSGGSISLTQVQGSIKASTASGPITAFLMPVGRERKLRGPSQLVSGQGDIIIFIPRDLPVTIEAVIEAPAEHRVEADFPLHITRVATGPTSRPIRAEAELNGGGELVKLRTVAGNIRLHWAGAIAEIVPSPRSFDNVRYRLEMQQKALEKMLRRQQEELDRDLMREVEDAVQSWDAAKGRGRAEIIMDRLRMAWDKTLRISGSAMKDKAVEAPKPVYPVLARQQGIQGRVRVEVAVKPSGEVESVKALSGHPLLQQAAVDAVRKWRYVPTLYDGKPVSVITTVDFDFKLN